MGCIQDRVGQPFLAQSEHAVACRALARKYDPVRLLYVRRLGCNPNIGPGFRQAAQSIVHGTQVAETEVNNGDGLHRKAEWNGAIERL